MLIKINGVTEETSKAGKKYWKVQTNKGVMSVFDEPVVGKLYECWRTQQEIDVDAQQSKDLKYVNIRGFEQPVTKPIMRKPSPQADYNPTSMYVSYAKDIFIALQPSGLEGNAEERMKLAINLVKQAHKEFS